MIEGIQKISRQIEGIHSKASAISRVLPFQRFVFRNGGVFLRLRRLPTYESVDMCVCVSSWSKTTDEVLWRGKTKKGTDVEMQKSTRAEVRERFKVTTLLKGGCTDRLRQTNAWTCVMCRVCVVRLVHVAFVEQLVGWFAENLVSFVQRYLEGAWSH